MMQTTPVYNKAVTVSKSDTVDIPEVAQWGLTGGLYVGGAGTVVAVFQDGSLGTFEVTTVPYLLPIAIKRVNATNTDASSMVAVWSL